MSSPVSIRAYTFEIPGEGWSVTERALVVLSRTLRCRQRVRHLREHQATLRPIAGERLNRRKYKRRAYIWEQVPKQVLAQPEGEFWRVTPAEEDGALRLGRELDVEALWAALVLDGKFILVSNDRGLSGKETG